jgi:hypothetical protein
MKTLLINAIFGILYGSMSVWEMTIASVHPSVSGMNDMARCFLITMSALNLIMGLSSVYLVILFWNQDESERYAMNISTGTSIWGLVLYFKFYYEVISDFQLAILGEMVFFFIRMAILVGMSCYLCKHQEIQDIV